MRRKQSILGVIMTGLMLMTAACSYIGPHRSAAALSSPTAQVVSGTKLAESVLQQFKRNKLPIGESFTFSAANDTDRLLGTPKQYVGKITFQDTRLKTHVHGSSITVVDGGSIEVFPDQQAVTEAKHYLTALNGDGALFFTEYNYWNGIVLVRVSSQLDPQQARDYAAVVASLPTVNAVASALAVTAKA